MSLLEPAAENQIDLTQPRLHALIIGVGEYPHLIGGNGHPAVANFGLPQLTTTQFTAVAIANWLATSYSNPACPLGSIELLMAPGQNVPRRDGSVLAIETSSMGNIKAAFGRWHARCHSQAGNIALFYFSGHGISAASQFLLPSDFGDPQHPDLWENCIDFDGMRVGMYANNANTQLFFVDACRERPIDSLIQRNPHGASLCSATVTDAVQCTAAYYAAADGRRAYGPPNDVTYFGKAVLTALSGAGALNRGGGRWVVDTFSLGTAIGKLMDLRARSEKLPLRCNPDPDGMPMPVHYPPGGLVHTAISCRTPQANQESHIELARAATLLQSPPGSPRPWLESVEPGDWAIRMNFQSFPAMAATELLMPPVFEMEYPT